MNVREARKKIVKVKMYLHRSNSYLIIAQFLMIGLLFLDKVRELSGLEINLKVWGVPTMILVIFGAVFVGWLDDYFKFFEEETRTIQKRNPDLQKILKIVEELKDEHR